MNITPPESLDFFEELTGKCRSLERIFNLAILGATRWDFLVYTGANNVEEIEDGTQGQVESFEMAFSEGLDNYLEFFKLR